MFWLHFLVQGQWNSGSLSDIRVAYEKYQTANSPKAEQKNYSFERRVNLEFTGVHVLMSTHVLISSDKP